MSIQLGDILQHNNLVYPIVDISDVKGGLRSIVTFGSASLASEYTSIPEKYKTGYSLLLEKSTGNIYYLAGTDATNVNHWSSIGVGGNGYGIPSTIPKWITSSTLGNSNITDNGDTIIISGNLMVIGTTSTISSQNLLVKDPIILLAGSQSGTPTYDAGLFVNRGSSDTQAFIWDESEKEFKFISTTSDATTSGNVLIGTYSSVRTGVLSVGTGSKVNSRFIVSSSGGTVSLIVDEFGNVYNNGNGGISTNTVFGASALSKTTGINNTAFGVSALLSSTTGYNNTAIGVSALLSNISGIFNTAIGSDSLKFNLSNFNTALGHGSLFSNTTGQQNTAIGVSSGQSTISGVGATNSNSSIFIGYDTRPQLDSQTNQIVIGHGATGNGSNTINLGNDSITKTYLKGSVYIGIRGGGTVSLVVDEFGNVYNRGNGGIVTNTAFGASALSVNTTGYQNTALGYQSLHSNTTGYNNTAIGYNSLFNNKTGSENIAIGVSSLQSNTNAINNIAIGRDGLYSNTTGDTNIAVGISSLESNTTGYRNIAIGVSSLYYNATGSNNTALGVYALYNNKANENTAVGAQALYYNTTGTGNVALGYESLFTNSTGLANTAVGYQALRLNTGLANTAVGYQALSKNLGGTDNVAIGVSTLGENTTGTANIAIGSSALLNSNTDDNVAIGTSCLSYSTTGTFNVGIGSLTLFSNTTGSQNTAIGNNSLALNTIGCNNTAIGNQAGPSIVGTNSRNSIFIGNLAGQYSTGYDNEIVIGSTVSYGNNSVVLGNNSTTKTYLKGSVQLPTMTTTEINLVSGPTDGQVIYNTTLHQICFYNGSSWRKVTDSVM